MTKSNVGSFSLIPVMFVLTLFLLLSALSISIILAGSTVYEKISDSMDNNYDRRVSFSYITNQIRQNDSKGCISIETKYDDKNDCDVNMIAIKDDDLIIYIYYYDGYIWTTPRENDDTPLDFGFDWGDKIIEAEGFDFDFSEDLTQIRMSLTDKNGNTQSTT